MDTLAGISLDSCFFEDKESTLIFEHTDSSSPQNVPTNTHRKIQRYVIGNSGDSVDSVGHGTHVACSIAGKTLNSNELSNFNGVAKDAKLAFYDIVMGDSSAAVPASSLSDFFEYASVQSYPTNITRSTNYCFCVITFDHFVGMQVELASTPTAGDRKRSQPLSRTRRRPNQWIATYTIIATSPSSLLPATTVAMIDRTHWRLPGRLRTRSALGSLSPLPIHSKARSARREFSQTRLSAVSNLLPT